MKKKPKKIDLDKFEEEWPGYMGVGKKKFNNAKMTASGKTTAQLRVLRKKAKKTNLGQLLIAAVREAVQHIQGKKKLRTTKRSID